MLVASVILRHSSYPLLTENITLAGVLAAILVAIVVRLFRPAISSIAKLYIFCQLFPSPIFTLFTYAVKASSAVMVSVALCWPHLMLKSDSKTTT